MTTKESNYSRIKDRVKSLEDGEDVNLKVGLFLMCRLLDHTTMDYDTRERIHEGIINQLEDE